MIKMKYKLNFQIDVAYNFIIALFDAHKCPKQLTKWYIENAVVFSALYNANNEYIRFILLHISLK